MADTDQKMGPPVVAARLWPGYARAHAILGGTLEEKGDLHGAIAELREAVRLKPDLAEAHFLLSDALAQNGDLKGAAAEFRKTLRLEPGYPGARAALDSLPPKKATHHAKR